MTTSGDDDEHDALEIADEMRKTGESEADVKSRKRKERLEQNRISARESRKRKKTMIEELQRTVITLSRENKDLNERNESLRRQLIEIGAKYPNVAPLQAIVGQGTATSVVANGVDVLTTTPSEQPTTTTAPSPATANATSALSGLNPMNWITGGRSSEQQNQADV